MREFIAYKENVNILDFLEAANTMDEKREIKKTKAKNG